MADTHIVFGSGQLTVNEDGELKVASTGGFDDTNIVDELQDIEALLGATPPSGSALIPVTFTLDTGIYAANEVLSDTAVITNFFAVADGVADIYTIKLHDKDDQTPYDIRVYLMDSNVSLGTKNNAISISDTDAGHILTIIEIAAADAIDVINGRIYVAKFSPRTVRAATGTRNLYVALQVGAVGTPTHTASGIVGEFGGG